MLSDIVWTVKLPKLGNSALCGFRSGKLARQHVLKHFFNRQEQWQDLGAKVSDFRQELAGMLGGEDRIRQEAYRDARLHDCLNRAAREYVSCTREHSGTEKIWLAEKLLERRGGVALTCLHIVSISGIYEVFHRIEDQPSHLLTSFRPLPRIIRGTVNRVHYLYAAQKKLADAMLKAMKHQPKKKRQKGKRR